MPVSNDSNSLNLNIDGAQIQANDADEDGIIDGRELKVTTDDGRELTRQRAVTFLRRHDSFVGGIKFRGSSYEDVENTFNQLHDLQGRIAQFADNSDAFLANLLTRSEDSIDPLRVFMAQLFESFASILQRSATNNSIENHLLELIHKADVAIYNHVKDLIDTNGDLPSELTGSESEIIKIIIVLDALNQLSYWGEDSFVIRSRAKFDVNFDINPNEFVESNLTRFEGRLAEYGRKSAHAVLGWAYSFKHALEHIPDNPTTDTDFTMGSIQGEIRQLFRAYSGLVENVPLLFKYVQVEVVQNSEGWDQLDSEAWKSRSWQYLQDTPRQNGFLSEFLASLLETLDSKIESLQGQNEQYGEIVRTISQLKTFLLHYIPELDSN